MLGPKAMEDISDRAGKRTRDQADKFLDEFEPELDARMRARFKVAMSWAAGYASMSALLDATDHIRHEQNTREGR